MASVDQKVVSMVFDNSRFQGAVAATLGTLKKLEQALQMGNASKGLEGVSKAASQINLSDIGAKVDGLSSKFSGLQAIATGAMFAIGNAAVGMGQKLASSMTESIRQGFGEYETKIGSVQTILANTYKHGTKLADVTKSLGELNDYADKTIYSFGDMTRNIGLFTNAGLKLETSTSMIKGFSNTAAASGTNAQGAANAAYQLSQALSAGTIRLMDWRSLQNVGMGNDNMKNGLLDIAKAMKTIDPKTAQAAMKDFNGSLEKGWLSADVMSNYLQIMAGDMDATKMKALGLSDAQIKAFQAQQKIAEEAATKVRTFSQLTGTLMEAMGSGWAQSFELMFGDFDQATALFSGINKELSGIIEASTTARNALIKGWVDMGGRAAIIDGVAVGFKNLMSIMKVVGDAFSKVFGISVKDGAAQLTNLSKGFKEFMQSLTPSAAQLKTLGNIMVAVFTTIKAVGGTAFVGIVAALKVLNAVIGVVGAAIGAGLQRIGEIISSFAAGFGAIELGNPFEIATAAVKSLVDILDRAKDAIASWSNSAKSTDGAIKSFDIVRTAGLALRTVLEAIREGLADIGSFAIKVKNAVVGAVQFIGGQLMNLLKSFNLSGMIDGIKNMNKDFAKAFEGFDFGVITSIVSSGALVMVAKYVKDIFSSFSDLSGSIQDFIAIGGAIKDAFASLGGALDGAKSALKANAIKSIAVSLLILVAAMYVLSKVEPDKLGVAATGMAVALTTLATSLMMIDKMPMNAGKILALGAALVVLSGAILTMGLAVLIFGNMSWEQLVKGMLALGLTLGMLVLSVAAFSVMGGNLIKVAVSLQILSGALLILTGVVALFGAMPIDMLLQGGLAIGVLMGALVLFVAMMPEAQLMGTAAGMVLMGFAIAGLVASVAALGAIPLDNLIQGLGALAVTMGLLVVAARFAQGSMMGAAAMILMATAIGMLAAPLIAFSLIPADSVAQSLIVLAGSLGILVAASMLMQGALAGAAAMLVIAISMNVLAGAILMLGSAGPDTVVTGLLALGGALIGFAAAAVLLTPAIGAMAALGGVLLLFGAGIFAIGGGILTLAAGLAALGGASAMGAAGLSILASAVLALAPQALVIVGMGAAFVALGAGLVVVGAGAVLAGAGFLLLGIGLTLIAAAAIPGVMGLTTLVDAVSNMVWQLPQLGAMALAFAGLGAAFVVMGAGAALLAVGALAVSIAILALTGASVPASMAIEMLGRAFKMAAEGNAPAMFADAVIRAMDAVRPLNDAMNAANGSVNAFGGALFSVTTAAMMASAALIGLGSSSAQASGMMTGAMASMTSSTMAGVAGITAALSMLGPAVSATNGQVTAAAIMMAGAFMIMGSQSAAAVRSGSAQIVAGLAPLPKQVASSAVAVTAASMLMVAAFRSMGSTSVTAINTSGSQIRSALSSIAASSGSSAVSVGTAILSGMARGMANSSIVTAAARRVAAAALAAAKDTLGIHSPSKEFEQVGAFANEGFARGLSGVTKAVNPVDEAFKEMRDKITDAIKSTNERIAKAQANINKYRKNKKAKKELAAARKELADAQVANARARNASVSLQRMWGREGVRLKQLRAEYDKMADRVKDAESAYKDAVSKRDDAIKQYADKYGELPTIATETTYASYIKDMQQLTQETKNYHMLLEQLRSKGLNDKLYTQLLDSGTESLPFVQDILMQGDNAIKNLNKVSNDLGSVSSLMGQRAGINLYQAGVNAAEGFLKGLQAKESQLAAAIAGLTTTIVNKVKSDLKIKSPSRVMAGLGKFATEGLAQGVGEGAPVLRRSAQKLSEQFQKDIDHEFRQLTDPISDIFQGDPVVRPVMDLSDIESGAAAIQALLASGSLRPDISVNAANGVSRAVHTSKDLDVAGAVGGGVTYNYVQNNTSPKALSSSEIYRQTNNQISKIRKRL